MNNVSELARALVASVQVDTTASLAEIATRIVEAWAWSQRRVVSDWERQRLQSAVWRELQRRE